MLKSIKIRDFFSFKGEKTIELNKGVNLLLGINGSGKTSFINALRLLSEGIAGDGLVKLIQEQWGGYDQVVNCNGERTAPYAQITYVFDYNKLNALNPKASFRADVHYRITIRRSGTSYTLNERVYTEHKKIDDASFTYLDFSNGNGKISTRTPDGAIALQDYTDIDISGQELILRQINDAVHYLPTHTLRKAIESIAVYNDFDVSEGSKLRATAEYSTDTRLRKSGANLTHILNNLKLNYTFDFERLEETFRNVNPYFKSIEISNLYGQSYLSLREKNMSKAIGALHISDGTLRFLLMESVFYNPSRGVLVAIDEPERGMHPDMIRSIADMMKHAAGQSQIIVATHSPHLLNQFELEDILVFEKDSENSTIIRRVSESDFPDWEGEYLPGQMWLLGQIGGKRW
ncbi:MAG TPA: chromosome segregation protein SMC [Porphyromonadaceae bacterium]|nr:chromosome segregation protein SMC [Porphyromonadaceae bacterium]